MDTFQDNIHVLVIFAMLGSFVIIGLFLTVLYILQNRIWRDRQQKKHRELSHQQNLIKSILDAEEAERQKIGRDLHDGVGAKLANLRLNLDNFFPDISFSGKTTNGKLEIKNLIDQISTEVRQASHQLTPEILSLFTLGEAIEHLFTGIHSKSLHIQFDHQKLRLLNFFNTGKSVAIYRILQELLQNTIKHANATSIKFDVTEFSDYINCMYWDNGKGCDFSTIGSLGLGLKNLEARIQILEGTYHIESSPKAGFKVEIFLPKSVIINAESKN